MGTMSAMGPLVIIPPAMAAEASDQMDPFFIQKPGGKLPDTQNNPSHEHGICPDIMVN